MRILTKLLKAIPLKAFFLLLIRGYQYFISPLLGQNCRFYPSCSCYAKQAIEQRGLIFGLYLSVRRILKCNPWHPGGLDPVPPKQQKRQNACLCTESEVEIK